MAVMEQNARVNRVREWAASVSSPRELTLHVQGIPTEYTKSIFMSFINSLGFAGTYDYLYLPRCFRTQKSKGYAFVNFTAHELAQRFTETMDGRLIDSNSSLRVLVSTTQGLEENMVRWVRARSRRVRDPEVLPFVAPLETLGVAHPSEAHVRGPSCSEMPIPRFSPEDEAAEGPPAAPPCGPSARAIGPPGTWEHHAAAPAGAARPAPREVLGGSACPQPLLHGGVHGGQQAKCGRASPAAVCGAEPQDAHQYDLQHFASQGASLAPAGAAAQGPCSGSDTVCVVYRLSL